jgi:hypothetical protein
VRRLLRLPLRAPSFLRRLADRPFATALGFLLFAGAITALSGTGLTADALEGLVPRWALNLFAGTYGLGGALILAGLGKMRANLEAAGCVLVASGLAVRLIALYYSLGVTVPTISTGIFYVVFGWACLERFRQIVQGDRIIRVHETFRFLEEGDVDGSE